jgi:hypothetical protein
MQQLTLLVALIPPQQAVPVKSQVRSCEICGGQKGTGVGFLRILRFPLPILIPPTAPHSLIILSSTLYSLDTESTVKRPTFKKA